MTAKQVRKSYGITVKRGQSISVDGRPGVVVSFPGMALGVRFTGDKHTTRCHPTWRVDFTPESN